MLSSIEGERTLCALETEALVPAVSDVGLQRGEEAGTQSGGRNQ